jgi:hypothetical protein
MALASRGLAVWPLAILFAIKTGVWYLLLVCQHDHSLYRDCMNNRFR